MRVSLLLALLSANSRLLMSFRRTLYLFICSQMISSTHLQWERKLGKKKFNDGKVKPSLIQRASSQSQFPNCCKMPFKTTEEDQEARRDVTTS